ncbi:FHA domain-containing protein [Aquimarina hainanensis]|uniref:FHA domain-containing protein n=1 Tax=Aquimarina hainanensis TaxID=1578017 RepID=A0ABW5NB09_9FLAO|nr:FHA domain-containing protein [Aquimarina sp. TRL1]QKX07053.1 FHA domain-containing protein [Aquimarina sp. TRL1]
MATLKDNQLGKVIVLSTQHLFGRNKAVVNTFLPENDVSKSHAIIFWKGDSWYLQDQSKNGTLVDNKFIHNDIIQLKVGQKIKFTQRNDSFWKITNLNKPCSYIQNIFDASYIELDLGVLLINNDVKDCMLYINEDKKWILENDERSMIINDGDFIRFQNQHWIFHKNEDLEDTVRSKNILKNITFLFEVCPSYNEVIITVLINDYKIVLGASSSHLILLLLAKKVQEDMSLEIPSSHIGWIKTETLIDVLNESISGHIDSHFINEQLYQVRKELYEIENYGHLLGSLIEKKNARIRFNHSRIAITESSTSLKID